jgi:hypothetical protein
MPTLKEIKDMLVKAEQEAESAIESVFEEKTETSVTGPAPEVPEAGTPGVEPVFVTEKPYGQVDGIPGVKYQQDGEYFDSQRKFVRRA